MKKDDFDLQLCELVDLALTDLDPMVVIGVLETVKLEVVDDLYETSDDS